MPGRDLLPRPGLWPAHVPQGVRGCFFALMGDRAKMTREDLRAALPELAEFVDACREAFGDGVRVLGVRTDTFTLGRPELDGDGIRLSQTTAAGNVCAPDLSEPAQPARRRR